jgi:hypothetical protein
MPVEPTKRVYEAPPIKKEEPLPSSAQKKKPKQQKKETEQKEPEREQGKVDIKI